MRIDELVKSMIERSLTVTVVLPVGVALPVGVVLPISLYVLFRFVER